MEFYRLNEIEQLMDDDFEWAMAAPEVLQHAGMFVIVHQKHVVAVGTDCEALLQQAAAKEACAEDDLVVVVVPPADLSEVPH
jgi:hypothetical protein